MGLTTLIHVCQFKKKLDAWLINNSLLGQCVTLCLVKESDVANHPINVACTLVERMLYINGRLRVKNTSHMRQAFVILDHLKTWYMYYIIYYCPLTVLSATRRRWLKTQLLFLPITFLSFKAKDQWRPISIRIWQCMHSDSRCIGFLLLSVDTPTCFMSLRLGDLINWISMRLCFGLLV